VISFYLEQKDNYDELFMTGYFNSADIFLKFYDPLKECSNCFIGGFARYDADKTQLFAVRPEELNELPERSTYEVIKEIVSPEEKVELVIIRVKTF
jgi:hypothetical protein